MRGSNTFATDSTVNLLNADNVTENNSDIFWKSRRFQ